MTLQLPLTCQRPLGTQQTANCVGCRDVLLSRSLLPCRKSNRKIHISYTYFIGHLPAWFSCIVLFTFIFRLICFGLTLGHLQRLSSKNNLKYYYGIQLYTVFVKMSIKLIIRSQLPCCLHQSGEVLSLQQRAASGGIPLGCSVGCISVN
jgi:hypothetical protein